MSLITSAERQLARSIAELAYCNPFLPERLKLEQAVLGDDFEPFTETWNIRADLEEQNPNLAALDATAAALADKLRERLAQGCSASPTEAATYEEIVSYTLYSRYRPKLSELIARAESKGGKVGQRATFYQDFAADRKHYLGFPGFDFRLSSPPQHLFAGLFQVRRAFHHVFDCFVGASAPAAELRAAVWQSIFTHDMRRYQRSLYRRMSDIGTLITGPSGTGKELVARAVGLSRYVPFDAEQQTFADNYRGSFHALNISALSPTLVESELFGHCRGAFTGALQDRVGWLEACSEFGAVFLDEIGDLDPGIQVKLLRVLQDRQFQRLGETQTREFRGRIIAATNRDLEADVEAGGLRRDFYYRLCADIVRTPSLREQLRDTPDDLPNFVRFLAKRIAGDDEADELTSETVSWIESRLGLDYDWPGNVRELEQCVRNILIRRDYRPNAPGRDAAGALAADIASGSLTADELLCRYCALVYAETGSYQETARRLGLDRRTVKAKVSAAAD